MDIGTIDLYHFLTLSVILTVVEGHKVSKKQKQTDLFSCTFHLIKMKFDQVLKQFKLTFLILLWRCNYVIKGKLLLFCNCIKKDSNAGMHWDVHELIFIQTWYYSTIGYSIV